MKRSMVWVLVAVLAASLVPLGVLAHWADGDGHKMHFPQHPDPVGWDVDVESSVVADDWRCSASGPVTAVHFWVSWQDDAPAGIQAIHLSIHDDDRTGPYSKPGALLWTADWDASGLTQFNWSYGMPDLGDQGWFSPQLGDVLPHDHTGYQLINCFNIETPFVQEVGKIYWLDVRMQSDQGNIGWKTSLEHFEDTAVFWSDAAGWVQLLDPTNEQQVLDMAFVIQGSEEEPPPSDVKWEQPPDLSQNGMDVDVTEDQEGPDILADDFECTQTGPITSVVIWASWYHDQLPQQPAGVDNPSWVSFDLSFHKDIPADQNPLGEYSMPGTTVWHEVFGPGQFMVEPYMDNLQEGWYDPRTGQYEFPGDTVCWKYTFPIADRPFLQEGTPDNPIVYWLDMSASPFGETNKLGWKTSEIHWNDDATWADGDEPYNGDWIELRYPTGHEMEGQSIDLAFRLLTGPATTTTTTLIPTTTTTTRIPATTTTIVPTTTTTTTTVPLPPNVKWIQRPDLTTNGMDVDVSSDPAGPSYIMADDFECRETGAITSVVVWASWYKDVVPQGGPDQVQFTLSFHSDVPTNASSTGYSMPGTTLWYRVFYPGDFTVEVFSDLLQEGWYDPTDGFYDPNGDTICWKYTFPIIDMPFVQTGTLVNPVVYWLDVSALPNDDLAKFGWKTSETNWNDDAVRVEGYEPYNGIWGELRYPPPHPYMGKSIDVAFMLQSGPTATTTTIVPTTTTTTRIPATTTTIVPTTTTTTTTVPPESEECAKWVQPPDDVYGMDIPSYTDSPFTAPTNMVAEDWLCDGRPVTAVRWWGSYVGYHDDPMTPPAPRPTGFWLTWYTDIPTNAAVPYSQPGVVLTNVYVPLLPFGVPSPPPGLVSEKFFGITDISHMGIPNFDFEIEYEYYVELEEPWLEKEGRVYWLGITALYWVPEPEPEPPSEPVVYPWGWKTTFPKWNWNDDAVRSFAMGPWEEMYYPPQVQPWDRAIDHVYRDKSVNMAFVLYTDVCPQRCKKWSQEPDMLTGTDMESWTHTDYEGPLRADDFISDGRPITDIHWWGSYVGFLADEDYGFERPPPKPWPAPDFFKLSWHTNQTAACLPGGLLTNIVVPASACHEMYFGTVTQTWHMGGAFTNYEHEFQYYLDLLDPPLGLEPWLEKAEGHYWLDIQAVYTNANWDPAIYPWGWKITPRTNECASAILPPGVAAWQTALIGDQDPEHPRPGEFDLAFELTTTNIPPVNSPWATPVGFEDAELILAADLLRMWTTGYCGCGKLVLQTSTNILVPGGGWADNQIRNVPRFRNVWDDVPLVETQRYYRVQQRN